MKRILLFVATNLAIMITISIVLACWGSVAIASRRGLDYSALMVFCLVWGMGERLSSLLMSRLMAKRAMGVQLVDGGTGHADLDWLYATFGQLTERPACRCREVGFYDSPEVNAFATGPSRKRQPRRGVDRPAALDAAREVEGVLAPRGVAHRERRHGDDDARSRAW